MDNKYVVLEEKTIAKVQIVLLGEKDEVILQATIDNELFLPFVVSEVTRVSGKKVAVNDGMPRTFDDLLAAETVLSEQEQVIEGLKSQIEELQSKMRLPRNKFTVSDETATLRIQELEEICEERAREIKKLKNPERTVVQATSGTLEEINDPPAAAPSESV